MRLGYDGSEFHGWAAQRSADPERPLRTVQGDVEAALAVLYKQPVSLRAASRTDAGVHALGQLAAFEPPSEIPLSGLVRGLNARLPATVAVFAAWAEPGEVDLRRENAGKLYRYRIRCSELADPLAARYEWHLGRALDVDRMQAAADHFVGTHDFASFRAASCQARTTERTIGRVTVRGRVAPVGPLGDPGRLDRLDGPTTEARPDVVEVEVEGTAFLHNMVRIMVGSLVDVGLGRRPPDYIADLLVHPDRRRAGMTAPAAGLTLVEVYWPTHPPKTDSAT